MQRRNEKREKVMEWNSGKKIEKRRCRKWDAIAVSLRLSIARLLFIF